MDEIQAITFDVGGTLIEPWPSVGHVYAAVAGEHGLTDTPPERLNRRFLSAWKATGRRAESKEDWAAIVKATFQGICPDVDAQLLFESLYSRFMEPSAWHVFEDVRPTLEALRGRALRLGILSNWDDRLRPLLTGLGLADYFEVMIVSCEVGFRKPDPEVFRAAAKALQVAPEQVLHVGDDADQDITGARAAGMNAMGIRRTDQGETGVWRSSLSAVLEYLEAPGSCANRPA